MGLAGWGQNRTHCPLSLVIPFTVELHREDVLQAAVRITPAVESARAAEHCQPATVADKVSYFVQVDRIEVSAMGKVIKDDHVEILQLLQKNIVDGKGDKTQLILRHIDTVSGSSEKHEGDQLYQRVLFHRHA